MLNGLQLLLLQQVAGNRGSAAIVAVAAEFLAAMGYKKIQKAMGYY